MQGEYREDVGLVEAEEFLERVRAAQSRKKRITHQSSAWARSNNNPSSSSGTTSSNNNNINISSASAGAAATPNNNNKTTGSINNEPAAGVNSSRNINIKETAAAEENKDGKLEEVSIERNGVVVPEDPGSPSDKSSAENHSSDGDHAAVGCWDMLLYRYQNFSQEFFIFSSDHLLIIRIHSRR